MNHRTLAAIAASSLLAAFAAQANKGADYEEHHAKHQDRYTVTGGLNYLHASHNTLPYLDVFESIDASGDVYAVDLNYGFGYFLGFGYLINDQYDVQASWLASNTNGNDSAEAGPHDSAKTINGIPLPFAALGTQIFTTTAHESLHYQTFDVNVGRISQLHHHLHSRVFAGLRYAKIDSFTQVDYALSGGSITGLYSPHLNSNFYGFGPEMGMDLNYKVRGVFGIVARVSGAFLIGEQTSETNAYYLIDQSAILSPVKAEETIPAQMVPALDAKLGMTFTFPFMEHHDRLVLEAGYEIDYYFNAVNQLQFQSYTGGGNGNNFQDVGIMGPYVNLSAKF